MLKIIFVFIVLIQTSFAKHSIVSNDQQLYSFLGDEWNNGYPEKKYHSVLDIFIRIYTPIIKARGGSFHILRDFSDGAVNAWAWRIGNEYHLEVPGGLSRYELINEEGFITTICHEIGHLLGGAPARNDTISFEGQSDYFSAVHCVRKMLKEIKPYKVLEHSAESNILCSQAEDNEICKRALLGAKAISNYFARLEDSEFPSLMNEDPRIARQTLQKHPSAQCRLDTFKRGHFCMGNFSEISYLDPLLGYCSDDFNKRPLCWYSELKDQL